MSVITYHEVSGNNIFDRLKSEGIIHEGDIYSPRRGEYVHFDNVFDYTKCDKVTLAELDDRDAKQTARYIESLNSMDYTEEEKATKIANYNKCDYHLMPVSKSNQGGVCWTLNYWSDDLPSVAIGRKYPNEIFEYYQETEGHLDVSCKFKGDKDVTDDGRPYEAVLFKISDNLIRQIDDKTSCVSLYVDSSDKRPARLYCSTNDIKPSDYTVNHAWQQGYSDIVIRDKSKDLTLYRVLNDGTKAKEKWSVEDLQESVQKVKDEYHQLLNKHNVQSIDLSDKITDQEVELN